MEMSLSLMLRNACKAMHFTMSELARRTNQTPQNLSVKLKRDTITFREFINYMDIMGIHVDLNLIYPNGMSPEMPVTDRRAAEKIALLEADLDIEHKKAVYQQEIATEIRRETYNIIGYADLATRNPYEQKKNQEYIKKIKTAGNSLCRLLDSAIYRDTTPMEDVQSVEFSSETIKGKRVLVVEDNNMNREMTKDILEENGFIVETAQDGAEAVKLVSENDPNHYCAVLMDIQMPTMDGMEATRRIRSLSNRIRAGIPIIAMTANTFENDLQKAVESGIDACLTKPVDNRKVVQTIAKYL